MMVVVTVPLLSGCGMMADAGGGSNSPAAANAGAPGGGGTGGPGGPGGGGGGRGGRGGRGGGGGPIPVVTGVASKKDVPVDITVVGNVEAYESVSVRSQVTGQVAAVHFHEGDPVQAGDLLFTVDPAPFKANLAQAEANLARDVALLNQAEAQRTRDQAQAQYQETTYQRNRELVERGIVSKDLAQQSQAAAAASASTVKADDAAVASARAQLQAQQAAVDTARLQLAYTSIKAPISGRTGNLSKIGRAHV